jgi:hypothetical protein
MRSVAITVTTTFLADVDDALVTDDDVNVAEIEKLVDWRIEGSELQIVVSSDERVSVDMHSTEIEVEAELIEDEEG